MTILKKIVFASLTTAAICGAAAPAHAFDIERWLRDTFSTRDYVGDWLRDTFAPANDEGGDFQSPSIQQDGYREAVEIMQTWPSVKNPGKKERIKAAQICSGEKLLNVILETKSEGKTIGTCFQIKG